MAGKLAFRLSRGIESTSRPPIPQAYKWAEAYAATPERPLLDMSQGVPGIPPPKSLLDALGRSSSSPAACGYVPNVGEPALRSAMVDEMKRAYGEDADITMDDIAITAGCNLAFATVAMSLAGAGDEVILPVPWYFNHEMTLNMLGIKTVMLQTFARDGFMPSPERCETLITPRTKAIVLITPNNPTGAVYSPSTIIAFANLARKHNIALIIDETYRDFILDGPPHPLFSSSPHPCLSTDWRWRSTFIHLFSFSKSYCIPGHRLGLICASPAFIPSINTALDNLQICAPRPPQIALAPLLPSLRPFIRDTALSLVHRHTLFKSHLPPLWRIGSQGGYFAFVQHPFVGVHANDVCRRLAEERGVVCLPAGFFGPKTRNGGIPGEEDRWVRFSVANVDDKKVELVCERLEECQKLFGWDVDES